MTSSAFKMRGAIVGAVCATAIGVALLVATPAARAQTQVMPDPVSDYFAHWFERVDAAQASQPHWITPVATTTPRLEEEIRYDVFLERLGNGGRLDNFGGGKGLELIPTENTEIIVGIPPYIQRDVVKPANQWGDWPFLLIKYRLLSANEQNGNYILTAFLQGTAPTGGHTFTNNAYVITPTIAGGIGFGDFDIQATLGEAFLTGNTGATGPGNATVFNATAQYHLWNFLWPEIEINDTAWQGGTRGGKNQVFITPGVVIGRMPLFDRVKLIVGVGYQMAVSPHTVLTPLTPQYSNNLILTTRFTF